jgi:hypothetical protein
MSGIAINMMEGSNVALSTPKVVSTTPPTCTYRRGPFELGLALVEDDVS